MMSDDTDGPPRKKLRRAMEDGPELNSKPVLIRVGETGQEYHIHETILRSNSSFFDKVLKKDWTEGQDRAVDIPEANNEAFTIWTKWLYTGNLFLARSDDLSSDKKSNQENPRWSACYALGDFLLDRDFKDACIDAMVEHISSTKSYPCFLTSWIYHHSIQSSNHRMLAVDIFVNVWDRKDWDTDHNYPRQFLLDILKSIGRNVESGMKIKTQNQFFNLDDTCKYHDHGPHKPCYKTKPAFRS